jgi:hypothetical protein
VALHTGPTAHSGVPTATLSSHLNLLVFRPPRFKKQALNILRHYFFNERT